VLLNFFYQFKYSVPYVTLQQKLPNISCVTQLTHYKTSVLLQTVRFILNIFNAIFILKNTCLPHRNTNFHSYKRIKLEKQDPSCMENQTEIQANELINMSK
jgi:hypothetical protein